MAEKGKMLRRNLSHSDKFERLHADCIRRESDRYKALAVAGLAQTLYCLLLPWTDSYNHFTADPGSIRKTVLAFATYTNEEIQEALELLRDCGEDGGLGLIIIYWRDGKDYLEIVNAEKHQKVDYLGKPEYPLPENTKEEDYAEKFNIPQKNCFFGRKAEVLPGISEFSSIKEKRKIKEDTPDPHSSDQDIISKPENKKEIPQEKPKQTKVSEPPEIAYKLTDLLNKAILKTLPATRPPNRETWAKDMMGLLKTDNRPAEEVERIIKWLPSAPKRGTFCWGKIIRSPENLRKHYPVLLEESKQGTRASREVSSSLDPDNMTEAQKEQVWNESFLAEA